MAPTDRAEFLTTEQVAELLHLSPITLCKWRSSGMTGSGTTGPTFSRLGGRVVYRRSDVEEWVASRRASSTAQARALAGA
jgi:predicted DNA-binding transcriptional regulator AlpA